MFYENKSNLTEHKTDNLPENKDKTDNPHEDEDYYIPSISVVKQTILDKKIQAEKELNEFYNKTIKDICIKISNNLMNGHLNGDFDYCITSINIIKLINDIIEKFKNKDYILNLTYNPKFYKFYYDISLIL